jgi:hypothetical protein
LSNEKSIFALVILQCRTSCEETKIDYFTAVLYNVENLFDTKYEELITPRGDKKWDMAKYKTILTNLAKVIIDITEGEAPSFSWSMRNRK